MLTFLKKCSDCIKPIIIIWMMCLCCALWFTSIWAAESDHGLIKEAYSQYLSLFKQGNYAESLPYAEKALALSKSILGDKSKTTGTLSHNYGINLLRVKKAKQASKVLSDTIALYREIYGSHAPELIAVYVDLGDAMRTADYQSNWYSKHKSALSIAKEVYGKDSSYYGMLLLELGHIGLINQAPKSESTIRKGYKILKNLDSSNSDMSRVEFIMGKLELSNLNYKDAREHFESSLNFLNENDSSINFELSVRAFLVETLENLNESELATEHLLEIGRKQSEGGTANLEPLFIKKPSFPSSVNKQQTGSHLNVKKINEGTVALEYDVDEKGFTCNIRVIFLDGPNDYVEPAIEAVRQFRYAPRFVDGEPVVVRGLTYKFNFLLQ